MSNPKFAETHNLIAFLEKPKECDGFEQIIDFLNTSSIIYALTVNPTIYTSCIKQFWDTAKVQTINEEVQIKALVDGKKVIVTETSVRRALHLKDAKGTDCLPTATIFVELERMGAKTTAWNKFSSTMASAIILFLDKQVEGMSKHKEIYVTPSHTKKIFANMKREGKGFSGRVTSLFQTMMVQAPKEVGKGSAVPTDSHHTTTQPSTSRPQNKQSRRKQRKDSGPTEPVTDKAINEEHVSTPSYDLHQSENTNTSQASEILTLKEIVKKLEKKRRSRTYKPRRLYKVGLSRRIKSSDDASLGSQEDASKQGRKIADLDADTEPMVNSATTTSSIPVSAANPVTTAGEVVTTASVEIPEELTRAQTLIEIKSAKPKAVTTVATIVTHVSSRPKAKGIVFHDQEEQVPVSTLIVYPLQLPHVKDKGKAKMVEPEKPLKKKDQIAIHEEVARNLEAQLQAELEEEGRLSRQKEEETNISLIESWDNTQAMMDADFQLAQQMQTEEQEQLSIEEKSKLFVELLEKRKKYFPALRAKEKRNKPPTKTQKRNTMSTYLKNMDGYKHSQLKIKSYDEIQEMFDKEMKRINNFVDMDTELVKGSKTKAEGSSKRAREELKFDNSKKQKIDEHVEAEGDDDQEEAEMKKHMEIVQDKEVAIDAIPLATKPPIIVEWKIIKEGKMGYYQLIRADGSSKRPDEAYERVLWGDLKVMFEHDVESEIWRNLQVSVAGTKVNAAGMKVTTAERLKLLEEFLLTEG
ncbi:hypothetical protein Tco_0134681 [Tanacetum coccineum]